MHNVAFDAYSCSNTSEVKGEMDFFLIFKLRFVLQKTKKEKKMTAVQ